MKHGRVAANRLLSDPEQEPRYRVYLGKCLYPFVRREVVVRLRLDSCQGWFLTQLQSLTKYHRGGTTPLSGAVPRRGRHPPIKKRGEEKDFRSYLQPSIERTSTCR